MTPYREAYEPLAVRISVQSHLPKVRLLTTRATDNQTTSAYTVLTADFNHEMLPINLSHQGTESSSLSVLPSINDKTASSPPLRNRSARLSTVLSSQISLAHTSHILLVCCLMTGLLDSTLFNAYGTFVSGQTGNTILFGLGASTSHTTTRPYRWAKSLIAVIAYVSGCFVFARTTRKLGNRRRGTFILSFAVQGAIVLLAAGFIQAQLVEGRLHRLNEEIDWRQLLPIILLSFQSAGQIVASRALGHDTISTVVLTSMLHDIGADPRLFGKWYGNEKRNRMIGAFVAVVLGAVAGGFLSVSTGKIQSTLWVVGGLKMGIAVAWGLWPAA